MKRAIRWAGLALSGLVGLVVIVVGVIYGLSEYRIRRTYEVPGSAFTIPTDSASIVRGRHIAITRGCVDCHTGNLGGTKFLDVPAVGTIYSSNLTAGPGGIGASYTAADWDRAIRHGLRRDGRPLLIMPAQEYSVLSDEDLGALVAYLKSLPPVNSTPGPNRVGPLGRFLHVSGQAPLLPAEMIDHEAPHRPAPPVGPTVEYGAYLATGCTGCHGPGFSGGKIPGMPPQTPAARNLTPDAATGLGSWSEADFFRAMREGKRPDGAEIQAPMPWRLTAQMTDDEIRALWLYLRTVPAREAGRR